MVLLFLKMRPNLAELPEFLKLAASLGVDRVNAPNLDFIPAPEMEPLSLWFSRSAGPRNRGHTAGSRSRSRGLKNALPELQPLHPIMT